MRLLSNWRRVALRSWSLRLIVIAGLLSGAEYGLTEFGYRLPLPERSLALLSIAATMLAAIARLLAQASISGEDRGR